MKGILIVVLLGVLAGAGFIFTQNKAPTEKSKWAHLGGDFSLESTKGKFSLSEYKGNPVVLYFGFTSCPDVCPTSLSYLSGLIQKLPENMRQKVKSLFVTLDYKHDSPEKAQEYADFFGGNILGLSGTKEMIESVAKKYAVFFEYAEMDRSNMKYTINHSSRFYFIDKDGVLIESTADRVDYETFFKIVEQLTKEVL